MTKKFESIFNSNTEIDPNLNELFKKKIERDQKIEDVEMKDEEKSNVKSEKKTDKKVKKFDAETEKRTVFVGNLSKETKKEDLLKIFKSYGKIETVRFRNIVPEDITKPKKYAFITKQIHPNKQTINAYVRFKEEDAAKRAADEINGMEFKTYHLRVDIANKSKVHDNKKSVFLGGLPFDVLDEEVYSHFLKCGPIEFVRLIRDNRTGIGKGFGYVQFKTADTIALALRLDGSEIKERKIRVTRCVKKQKENKNETQKKNKNNSKDGNKTSNKIENKFQIKFDKLKSKRQEKKSSSKESLSPNTNQTTKPKTSKQDRAKSYKQIKSKKRKFSKKKHVSTNNKNLTKFKF